MNQNKTHQLLHMHAKQVCRRRVILAWCHSTTWYYPGTSQCTTRHVGYQVGAHGTRSHLVTAPGTGPITPLAAQLTMGWETIHMWNQWFPIQSQYSDVIKSNKSEWTSWKSCFISMINELKMMWLVDYEQFTIVAPLAAIRVTQWNSHLTYWGLPVVIIIVKL